MCFEQPHFRHGAPRSRPIFRAPARITGLGLPPKHCKNRDLRPRTPRTPLLNANGSVIEQLNRKKAPHFRTQQHIYIYMPENYFLYTFSPFWELVSLPPFFENLTFTAARSKMKVRNCTTAELFSVPPQGAFLPPQSGAVSNSQGGTISNFHFALCFPYLGLIGASEKQNINWKSGGHVGGTVSNFLKFGCYTL